jgi:copper transport protein
MIRRTLSFFLVTCLALATSPTLFAHAVLLGSTPQADQVLDAAPAEVVLNFNENVGPIFIRLLDLNGAAVGDAGEWRVDGNDVYLPLGDTLPNGTYILTYRVISADTHPVGSTFVFAVGEPITDASAVANEESGSTPWTWVVALNRLLLYGSVLLAAGSALVILLMTLSQASLAITAAQGRVAAMVALATYVLAIGLGGAEMVLGGAGALFSSAAWSQAMGSTLVPSAVIGIPGTLILLYALRNRAARPQVPLLLAGAALSLGGFLVTGHAATAPPAWLMAVVVGVHLVCAAFWFAALRPLGIATRSADLADAGALMVQFSNRAVWTVAALFVSGAIITFIQVESPANMVNSDYGLRLLLKIILFLVVLSIAAINKIKLTPRLGAGDRSSAASMRRAITVEYGVMVAILVAAVSLTLPSPPRAMMAQANAAGGSSGMLKVSGESRGYVVNMEISPGKPGENMVMFSFTDAAGNPVEMQRVDTSWSLPAAGLEGIDRGTEKMGPQMFHLMTSDLILPGEWQVRVGAYVDDFDKVNITATVKIQ